jgi:NFU1 iron-sulfur cluster scaffold homolog, mitochondrial
VSAPAIHVERTGDPASMRWVCHRHDLGSSGIRQPSREDTTPLASLYRSGEIVGIRTICGDLLVTADASQWRALAPRVHAAIVAELLSIPAWLQRTPATVDDVVPLPSVDEVQAAVDEAAGAVAASHGGRIEVATVTDDGVRVVLHGACHGCSGANTTLNDLVRRAVSNRWPFLQTLTEEPTRNTAVPVMMARRRGAGVAS